MIISKKTQLIVALDLPSAQPVPALLRTMPPAISWFKVGLELFCADGPLALTYLQTAHKQIFLDLKLHDIPNTVARAVTAAARLGASMITIHASGGSNMLRAAADAAAAFGTHRPRLLGVTTLTSLDTEDLAQIGITCPLQEHAFKLGELAVRAGLDGLVCSVLEAVHFRKEFGENVLLVTPGIRPADTTANDQKRIATPADAVAAGADFLVVGRPILQAENPATAALRILKEIEQAQQHATDQ